MVSGLCLCTYIGFWYNPSSAFIATIEVLVICLICSICVIVNYKFRKKLKEEKKNRPLGRKGNVIEPLMSCYCVILMFGTTYCQLIHWQFVNEIIPFHLIPEWVCIVLTTLERIVVSIILWNSMFTVLIRYVYIVHHQKANTWEFDKVGKNFQLASIVIPTGMEILHLCTNSRDMHLTKNTLEMGMAKFESCNNYFHGTNSTISPTSSNESIPNQHVQTLFSHDVAFVAYYFYVGVYAAIALNIVEGYLYIKIFRSIKRSNLDSYKKGIHNENGYKSREKRRLTSINVCFLGWLLEVLLTVLTGLWTLLQNIGLGRTVVYPYAEFFISFFRAVVVSFVFLLNDEETKTVITENNWYLGVRHALGLYRIPDDNANQ